MCSAASTAQTPAGARLNSASFNDAHFHLTNYVQEGIGIQRLLEMMGTTVGRSTLFGIPLQQQWSYRVTGAYAPTYYLDTDAPLYYYSFTDAYIASVYLSLSPDEQARFDPMITGFNPTDMYAADHIRRVLETFPGVFTGIGEFTIHKEFVSSKVAGGVASLTDPALDRLLDFAGDVGLLAIIHNDIAAPFFKPSSLTTNPTPLDAPRSAEDTIPINLSQMRDLLRRHPGTTIIWAHIGVGRIVQPLEVQVKIVEEILNDPALNHVYFDISWEEAAKYVMETPATIKRAADLVNRYPDRFLFGTDVVAPADTAQYFRIYHLYDRLWKMLTPEASRQVRKGNYERLFDAARRRVRAWEQAHVLMKNQRPGKNRRHP